MEKKDRLWTKDFITAALANFLIASSFHLLMPTIPIYLSEQLNVAPSKIGVVLSSYSLALLIIRPFCGYWVDVYSRKPLYMLGVSFFVMMFFGYYFAATVAVFVILRFAHGLFWGLTTVSSNTVAIDIVPSSRRAEGIGYFGVTMNIAMAFAPFIAVEIYNKFGFDTLVSVAIGMGILAILAVTQIKVPQRKRLDEVPPISLDRFILIKGLPVFFNQLFLSFGWGTLIAYAVLYGKQIDLQNSGMFFLFLASGIVVSRITSGRLVDRGHIHGVIVVAIAVIISGFVSFSMVHNIWMFSISAFALGVGYGTLLPALQTIYINMAPHTQRGTANSTYLTGFDVGIGLGMLLGASLADKLGYSNMYLVTAFLSFVALLIYWFNSRKVYEKNRLV